MNALEKVYQRLLDYARSEGTKPRRWAKVPVRTLRAAIADIDAAAKAEREASEAKAERIRKLMVRLIPFMEAELAILRRSVALAMRDGAGVLVCDAENKIQLLSTLLGEARKETEEE